eukprot:scaffold196097_cov22-Tisochrysis_lutea.AAC.2
MVDIPHRLELKDAAAVHIMCEASLLRLPCLWMIEQWGRVQELMALLIQCLHLFLQLMRRHAMRSDMLPAQQKHSNDMRSGLPPAHPLRYLIAALRKKRHDYACQ